jgi:uncharacterized protein YdiU (UPF0061 family)
LPLLGEDQDRAVAQVMEVLGTFQARYQHHWLQGMRQKLGLTREAADDFALATDFLATMEGQGVDFTQAFRRLSDVAALADPADDAGLRKLYADASALDAWLVRWHARLKSERVDAAQRARAMRAVNPVYIPRNHRVEAALYAAVEQGDFSPFEKLLAVLLRPYDEQAELADYAEPALAAQSAGYQTFCGT